MNKLPGRSICTLDEDWSASSFVESDRRMFDYEMMSGGKASSRNTYQRYLKKNGRNDDVSLKELRRSDMGAKRRRDHETETINKFTDNIFKGFRYGNTPKQSPNQHQLKNRLGQYFIKP